MSISDRLDQIEARADAATEGPWERGDHYHVQAASHCQCWPEHGPLISEKRMDINGTMRLAHVHRRSEPLWGYGIYATTEYGGALVVNETSEYGYMDDADAEFIAASRTDVPALVAALRAVLDLCELIEKAHAANPKQTYEQGMEVAAHKVRTVIAAALGEGS